MHTNPHTRRLAAVIAALAIMAVTACGGGDYDDCRPDFVGPPAPEQADLPVCQ